MRTFKSTSVLAVVFSLLLAATSFGQFGFGPGAVDFFDFSGWVPSQVQSPGGQTFAVGNGINVNVQGVGDFTVPSNFNTVTNFIESGHLTSGDRNQYLFTFDTTLPIVVKAATVDPDEQVEVIGVGPETYSHISGLVPTQTAIQSGLELQGNGFGANASQGLVISMAQQNLPFIVRHDSLNNNKFEFFMIGTIVPEPNSAALLGVGAIGLLLSGRKRRRRNS